MKGHPDVAAFLGLEGWKWGVFLLRMGLVQSRRRTMTHIRNTTMRSFLRTMTHYRIEKRGIFPFWNPTKSVLRPIWPTYELKRWHFELYRAAWKVFKEIYRRIWIVIFSYSFPIIMYYSFPIIASDSRREMCLKDHILCHE